MRIAVVSPFLDRRHGAERCVVEQIERFCGQPGTEIHIYAQSIQDLEVVRFRAPGSPEGAAGKPVWHRLPIFPGPHLFNFLWWFLANFGLRWFHRHFRSLGYDVVYSPGINCPDADAIAVHVVFREFFRHVRASLRLRSTPLRSWPATIHRVLYYRLIMFLESLIYRNNDVRLAAVSRLTARELKLYAHRDDVTVIPNAVDPTIFNPEVRLRRRGTARTVFRLTESDFVLLLLGNGWKNKGLATVLEALGANSPLPIKLLVVGRDDRTLFHDQIQRLRLEECVLFAEPSEDVLQFYAAADAYAGPSLHDSFALPPLEAMACGLPVITSAQNGGSQIITEGVDGFVLKNPQDTIGLAGLIRRLWEQPDLRAQVGANAAATAKSFTWDCNARETFAFLMTACSRKELQ